jgi:hypothetical protein
MSPLRLCLLLPLLGCAAPSAPLHATTGHRTQMELFFPLHDGHLYTYQLTGGTEAPEMFMVRVKRLGPSIAQLITGTSVKVLTITPEAVRREGYGTVLQAPLQPGASWQGDKGLVRVAQTDATLEVPAGRFTGCVKTVEEVGGDARGTIETHFCPEVGIARIQVQQWQGDAQASQTVELRSFGAPMDLR